MPILLELSNIQIPWVWVLLSAYFFVSFAIKTEDDENHDDVITQSLPPMMILAFVLTMLMACWLGYQLNYASGSDIVKLQTSSQVYVGKIAYKPFLQDVSMQLMPSYPIMNCPHADCLVSISKADIMNITIIR